jgi:hypothetical protein
MRLIESGADCGGLQVSSSATMGILSLQEGHLDDSSLATFLETCVSGERTVW